MPFKTPLHEMDDDSLAALAQAQLPYQVAAYSQLMQRHQGKIYALCLKTLSDPSDAEDLSQDVMLKIFHTLKSFSGKSKVSTWIYRVTTNTCIDYLRKHQRTTAFDVPIDDAMNVPMKNTNDAKIQVDKMLSTLSAKDQMIINLKFTVGLTLEEIATTMQLGQSAVKMRYYRSMNKLNSLTQVDEPLH